MLDGHGSRQGWGPGRLPCAATDASLGLVLLAGRIKDGALVGSVIMSWGHRYGAIILALGFRVLKRGPP